MAAPAGANLFGTAASSGASGANLFGSAEAPAPASTPSGRHGSLLGNLAHEVGSAITGLAVQPAHFVENLATHPIATVEHAPHDIKKFVGSTIHQEGQTWSPFFQYYNHLTRYWIARAEGDHATATKEHALAEKFNNEFNTNFHNAPAVPLADLLAAVTGGAGRIAALSHVPEDATLGQIAKTAALKGERIGTPKVLHVNVGEKSVPVRTLPRNAYRAGRMEFTHKLLTSDRLKPSAPVIGQEARAARALRNDAGQVRMRLMNSDEYPAYLRAFGRLSKWQRAAVQMIAKLSTSENLDRHIANLRTNSAADVARAEAKLRAAKTPLQTKNARQALATAKAMQKTSEQQAALLSHPEFRQAYDHPNGKVLAAVDAARALSARREEILTSLGEKPDQLATSVFKHIRTVHGATISKVTAPLDEGTKVGDTVRVIGKNHEGKIVALNGGGPAFKGLGTMELDTRIAELRRFIQANEGHEIDAAHQHEVIQAKKNLAIVQHLRDAGGIAAKDEEPRTATVFYPRFGRSSTVSVDRLEHVGPEMLQGGGDIAEHQAAIEAAGRPQPFYMPDVLDEGTQLTKGRRLAGQPTGLLPAASDVRVWQGTLFKTGQLALHPDVLSASFLRSVTRAYGQDLFEHVREIATPVERGAGLPAGYRWVREKRGEKIPFTESHGAEHVANTNREFPEIHNELGDLFSDDPHLSADEIATDAEGRRLAVPQKFADELRVQQRAPRGAISKFWDDSTQVWRALVLNLRIPWLENNIVGNHVLAAVRFAGVHGLKAYLGALGEVKGIKAVRRLLNMPETRRHLSDETLREIAPEHARHGTFIGTQLPANAASKVPVAVQKATRIPRRVVGVLPQMDRATEGFLRRFGLETELRRSPEFNRILKSMPRQTRDFNAAAKRFAEDPASIHAASREVNDALGNFNSLSFAEQNSIRQVVPFYAWYREITRIALKLPLDEPLRASILLRLGQAGGQQNPNWPSYFQGDVPIGHLDKQGRAELLSLRAMNPYTTPIDLARAVSALWSPKRSAGQQAQGLLNPFIALLAGTIDKSANGDQHAQGVLQAFYNDFVSNLPEVRIGTNPKSKLYPGRTREDLALQFLGDLRRRYSPSQAATYAQAGD